MPRRTTTYLSIALLHLASLSLGACSISLGSDRFDTHAIEHLRKPALSVELSHRLGEEAGAFSEYGLGVFTRSVSNAGLPGGGARVLEVDATWRFFPVRIPRVEPYVGGGAGYWRFYSESTFSTCPLGWYCWPEDAFQESVITSHGSGFNPHIVVGSHVLFGRDWSFRVEVAREFIKRAFPYDLRSLRLMLGVQYQPEDL